MHHTVAYTSKTSNVRPQPQLFQFVFNAYNALSLNDGKVEKVILDPYPDLDQF